MLNQYRKWKKQREERAMTESYRRGFDYAAGMLLRQQASPAELEQQYQTGSTFNENKILRRFDIGMYDAVETVVNAKFVEDNRVYPTTFI